ncbi:MAG: DUF3422 domain-containing protein, partial [Sphingomicrobium sp.]
MIHERQYHPLRSALSAEMHLRKLPPLKPGVRMAQIVLLPGEDRDWKQIEAHLGLLCSHAAPNVDPQSRYFRETIGDTIFRWERHGEFCSFTFICDAPDAPWFDDTPFRDTPAGWVEGLPGQVIRATRIAYVDKADAILPGSPFAAEDLVLCHVVGGRGEIRSDFRLHTDGFGRLLVVDHGLSGLEAALTVQRLQELSNYRNIALLGLPVAQSLTPEVSGIEQRLAALTVDIAAKQADDDRALAELSFLSAELARIMAATRFRMSATLAYADVVAARLRSLDIVKVPGHQTLTGFTERRLAPATRTCASFVTRLDDLSRRVGWTSDLLRTRIETATAAQSRDLLASMNRRTKLQLRLQHTVEGVSIVAISYYALGLLGYILPALGLSAHEKIVKAALVPIILLMAWLGFRRSRSSLK